MCVGVTHGDDVAVTSASHQLVMGTVEMDTAWDMGTWGDKGVRPWGVGGGDTGKMGRNLATDTGGREA